MPGKYFDRFDFNLYPYKEVVCSVFSTSSNGADSVDRDLQ